MSAAEALPWHAAQWRRLAAARRAGRMPHALLLAGAAGLGKSAFAQRLQNALLCTQPGEGGDACGQCSACRLSRAGTHPDCHRIVPEAEGKPIRIDAVREIAERNVLAAQSGGYRVFVLEPADALNRPAANALLKTLEEPASRAVLILVSSHPDRLAPTVRSRCQQVRFGLPPVTEVAGWLAGRVPESEAESLLAIAGGAPLRALEARESDWPGLARSLVAELDALKRRRNNPLQTVENWAAWPLNLLLGALQRCLADLVRLAAAGSVPVLYHPDLSPELQSLGQGIDLQALFRFGDELARLELESGRNLNVQMQIEHLVNRWLDTTRPGGH
jgi:DNA polymerase-3 subunit delta'